MNYEPCTTRDVRDANRDATNNFLDPKEIHTLQFPHSREAIVHSMKISLIEPDEIV